MQKTGFWKAMINELVDRKSVEEALVAAEKRILLNPPSTSQLIIYRYKISKKNLGEPNFF